MMQNNSQAFVCAATLCWSLLVASAQAAPITGGTGPGGFDLTNGTTTLKSWLDASDASTRFTDNGVTPAGNTDPVYLWQDKSGNNNSATATNSTTARPSYNATAVNGNPAIRFDPSGGAGIADAMLINAGLNITSSPYTVFILDQYYGATQGRTMQSTSQNWLIGKWGGANAFHVNGTWVTHPAGNAAGINNPTISEGTITGTPGQTTYFINGVNAIDDGNDSSNPTGAPGSFALGSAGVFPNEVSNSDISEIIVYTRALNIAERRIVENYLSAKYNVGSTTVGVGNRTLGVNDLYSGDLNTSGNFDREVFGVGRADASNQQLNSGAAGFGIEVTGGVNPGNLSDGEFILAGHNQATNSLIEVGDLSDPSVVGSRWDRVWFVDKTETDGVDATLAFDFEDSGLSTPMPGTSFQLLYSSTNDFINNYEILDEAFTSNNGTVTFNLLNASLLDGYYTLGVGIGYVPEPNSMLLMLGVLGCTMLRRRTNTIADAKAQA